MKLYIARHAQSKRNAGHQCPEDSELTDIGWEQAKRLGRRIQNYRLDKIYCSPTTRAKDTLKELKPYIARVPISFRKVVEEHSMGQYSAGGKDDWRAYWNEAASLGVEPQSFKPAGGESLQDTYERAGKFYSELVRRHSDESVLVMGHGLFSMYLILNSLGLDVTEGKYSELSNASLSEIWTDAGGKVKRYNVNDCSHLIGRPVLSRRRAYDDG